MEIDQQQQQQRLTSTTAPGKIFPSRSALALHYKSDWHRYNLKRREAGLAMLKEDDFKARLEAALALRKEREGREERSGTDHIKGGKNKKNKKKEKKKRGAVNVEAEAAEMTMKKEEEDATMEESNPAEEEKEEEEEEAPKIDPNQCLFDPHTSPTLQSNLSRMSRKYNFFIPDSEYLIDLEGLIGYCAEKIKLGHTCLYCQKAFSSWQGCQKHMIAKRHTRIRYEEGLDREEFDVFYDFTKADAEFLGVEESELRRLREERKKKKNKKEMEEIVEDDDDDDDDESGEWEDISSDEEMDDNDEDEELGEDEDDVYEGYEEEIATHGFDITPLGELIFPDGRIIGHRGLARYYKQRIAPQESNNEAVVSAKRAAGERLYRGRVYDMYAPSTSEEGGGEESNALALARAGGSISGAAAQGRAGNGILVGSKKGGFTTLSLYRYRAAVRKSRKGEEKGRRLQQRAQMNMNRMDKKGNRLMTNVSVAHAPR